MIKRYYDNLGEYLQDNKVLIIYGPRQVGKTTLLKKFLSATKLKYRFDTGEDLRVREAVSSSSISDLKNFVGDNELVVIDEAQSIPNVGLGLKLMVDHIDKLKVIATGSSSFDLANKVGEPLVGRSLILTLYPVAEMELAVERNRFDLESTLAERLIYGSYPEVITASAPAKKNIVENIMNSYLFKDVLNFDGIKKSKALVDLVKMLALQVGNEVSVNELATALGINARTVERYLDLLEKSFVLIPLYSFRRNLRNEIRSKRKYYFYDNGIRNAVISQFNSLSERNDIGALWENYLFMERMKKRSYRRIYANAYFWRTHQQKEIDLVEERDGRLFGYEFKWGEKKPHPPADWLKAYSNASYEVIDKSNFFEFII